MFNFGTSDRQVLYQSRTNIRTSTGQALVSKTKHKETVINNTNNNKLDQPKNENEVIDFFKKENWPILEAKKFYNHYRGIGWKVGGKTKIVDWKSTARNWIIKAGEIKKEQTKNKVDQNKDNLHVKINIKSNHLESYLSDI